MYRLGAWADNGNRGKVCVEASLEKWLTKLPSLTCADSKFRVRFHWEVEKYGLPGAIIERLVDNFGSLQALLGAEFDDLLQVDGVGESRARAVREGLSRLAESSILERYV